MTMSVKSTNISFDIGFNCGFKYGITLGQIDGLNRRESRNEEEIMVCLGEYIGGLNSEGFRAGATRGYDNGYLRGIESNAIVSKIIRHPFGVEIKTILLKSTK